MLKHTLFCHMGITATPVFLTITSKSKDTISNITVWFERNCNKKYIYIYTNYERSVLNSSDGFEYHGTKPRDFDMIGHTEKWRRKSTCKQFKEVHVSNIFINNELLHNFDKEAEDI